jgi:uncharacterized protein involved in oxidation of intracellular sulfur
MKLLLVVSSQPYSGTDVVWNALRLAGASLASGFQVQLFLMNEGVDLARNGGSMPESEFDLGAMLSDLIGEGVEVKLCGTCLTRCGLGKGEVISGTQVVGMVDLANWIQEADRVLSF